MLNPADIKIPDRVRVYDPRLRDIPAVERYKPAIVVRRYGMKSKFGLGCYDDLIDVVFDHRPHEVSRCHIVLRLESTPKDRVV